MENSEKITVASISRITNGKKETLISISDPKKHEKSETSKVFLTPQEAKILIQELQIILQID